VLAPYPYITSSGGPIATKLSNSDRSNSKVNAATSERRSGYQTTSKAPYLIRNDFGMRVAFSLPPHSDTTTRLHRRRRCLSGSDDQDQPPSQQPVGWNSRKWLCTDLRDRSPYLVSLRFDALSGLKSERPQRTTASESSSDCILRTIPGPPSYGGLAVGVTGALRVFEDAYRHLPW
jgi:hypothetical protein